MKTWKEEFQDEINEICTKMDMKPFRAFIFWYLKATEDILDQEIDSSITDRPNDGKIDAIYIDSDSHKVKVYQSKYSLSIGEKLINKDDIATFSKIYEYLENSSAHIDKLKDYVHEKLREKLDHAIRVIREEGYKPELIFITTNSINAHSSLFDQDKIVKIISAKQLEHKFLGWQHGHTPELGEVELSYAAIMKGPDHPNGFIANIPSSDLRRVYSKFHDKLFSRNVRIFYGDSGKKRFSPNPKVKETLIDSPEKFWYYNNGITILCDEVKTNNEVRTVILTNPQIINGCQTVSIIGKNQESNAILFARIIEIGDHMANQDLIDGIIEANNRQNPVDERILKSNHPLQVWLQRKLEPLGYYYERKEGQHKKEAKLHTNKQTKIDNRELVKANVAVICQPHQSLEDENELFSTRFSEIFRPERSYFEYLVPYLLLNKLKNARPSYVGSKEKRSVYKFAIWHILKIIYKNCSYLSKDSHRLAIVNLLRSNKFELDDKLITDIYERIYYLFRKSERYGENSGQRDFFKNAKTNEAILKDMPKFLLNKIEDFFQDQIEE